MTRDLYVASRSGYNPLYDEAMHTALDKLVDGEVVLTHDEQRVEDIERKAFNFLATIPVDNVVSIAFGQQVDTNSRGVGHCG